MPRFIIKYKAECPASQIRADFSITEVSLKKAKEGAEDWRLVSEWVSKKKFKFTIISVKKTLDKSK